MERREFIIRGLTRLGSAILAITAVSLAYFNWSGLEVWTVAFSAILPFLGIWFFVILAALALRRDQKAQKGRPFLDALIDLGTDVLTAVCLSTCVGILVACVVHMEVLTEQLHPSSTFINNFFKEPIKEGIYAASVALVSFAILIMLRAALSAQNMQEIGRILSEIRRAQHETKNVQDRALKLSAEAGAGTALATLLEQVLPATDSLRAEITKVLAAAGTCAQCWIGYASAKPNEPASKEAETIRLTAATAFLREATSDIARDERLAVSNIRYVTSLVCSTLIALDALAIKRGGEWRPVWLGLTTYSPELWFDDPANVLAGADMFLKDAGLPMGTIHLQYWGRYLRLLRFLMKDKRIPISIRVFCGSATEPDGVLCESIRFKRSKVLGFLFPCATNKKLTYKAPTVDEIPKVRDLALKMAVSLTKDAANEVPSESCLSTGRGGLLEVWLSDIRKLVNAENGAENGSVEKFLKDWHTKNAKDVPEKIRSYWEDIQAWELKYLSERSERKAGEIRNPKTKTPITKQLIADATGSPLSLPYVDGNPLEVMLDALLLYCDVEDESNSNVQPAPEAFLARWHPSSGSKAYFVGRPPEMPKKLERPEEMVEGLLVAMPKHGDVHVFGLVPTKDAPVDGANSVEWDKAKWVFAVKSAMDSPLGIARIDFLDLDHTAGTIDLGELTGATNGSKTPVGLTAIVKGLATWRNDLREDFRHMEVT